jgi:hypothetical protein
LQSFINPDEAVPLRPVLAFRPFSSRRPGNDVFYVPNLLIL